jgi:hypothetical protein
MGAPVSTVNCAEATGPSTSPGGRSARPAMVLTTPAGVILRLVGPTPVTLW